MNRLVSVTMFVAILVPCGCARGRASLAPTPMRAQEPVELPVVEPIRASINHSKIPADRETVRAGYEAEIPEEAVREQSPDDTAPVRPRPVTKPANRPATVPAADAKKSDAASVPMTIRTDANLAPGKPASKTAAVVGDTIITARELQTAMYVQLQIRKSQINEIPMEQRGPIAKRTLDTLIDRIMILQEGRRGIKKVQQWNMFTDFVEKSWKDKELPSLIRKEGVEDEVALRHKLEGFGESLEDIKDVWKMETMSRELLMMRVRDKVEKPGLTELEVYYAQHRNEPSFQREANVKWREILVPANDPKELPAARQKALALRAKVLAGEDFAKLAKANSGGVTAAMGGAWDTVPDGSVVPAINTALVKLPPGLLSPLIESPKGVHLIRVDGRTSAGTAPFVDVQRKIAETIFEERFTAAISAHLKKLRKTTSVTSPIFDLSEDYPSVVQENAKKDTETKPASLKK